MTGPARRLDDGTVSHVRAQLDHHLSSGARAVVAVSGGPDSVALLHLARQARQDLQLLVCHVRHGLRDDARDADVAAGHAAALDLDWTVRCAGPATGGQGPEDRSRIARYRVFAGVASEWGTTDVLLGHTADDQAETLLLRMARGTGLTGLAGMAPVAMHGGLRLHRPLLALRRALVHAQSAALETVRDPTNDDLDQRRGRVRREVLPALAGAAGDHVDVVPALARLAALARTDTEALDGWARVVARREIRAWGSARWVPAAVLVDLPRAVRNRVVRELLMRAGAPRPPDHATVERVVALAPGGVTDVAGGLRVTCAAAGLAVVPRAAAHLVEQPLSQHARVALPELGLVVRATPTDPTAVPTGVRGAPWKTGRGLPWEAVVPRPHGALRIRARRPGDQLAGGGPVKPLLEPVPRAVRGLVPLIVDRDDRVLWAAGLAVAPRVPDEPALALALERAS